MKIFLIICLASGLASSEKLDRSYLPPPGSKFSGGTPGDIDVPLEFPKRPTGQPQLDHGKPEIEINRRPVTPGSQKPGSNNFQNSYPKTTTSYAVTQTTTFAPDYVTGQPNVFLNGSNIPDDYQPIRGSGQGSHSQYRPGQIQSTIAPYGTARPAFPGRPGFNGMEYLPPVVGDNKIPGQVSNHAGPRYQSGIAHGPIYQDGKIISANVPGNVPSGLQQNQYLENPHTPATFAPQYQDGRFGPTSPGSQQNLDQFQGRLPSSTAATHYQTGQRVTTPESIQQNRYAGNRDYPSSTAAPQYQAGQNFPTSGPNQLNQSLGNQFPAKTAAPQYQAGTRISTPGYNQHNQFLGNQDYPSSTTAPGSESEQGITTSGLGQQIFGSRLPQQNQYSSNQHPGNQNFPSSSAAPIPGSIEQNLYNGNRYPGNQNFLSSTAAPTPGSIQQNQASGNMNSLSTSAPNYQYQAGESFTTPDQGLIPGQRPYGSEVFNKDQYPGKQIFPTTPATRLQDGQQFSTPENIQGGYEYPRPTQNNHNQYPGSQSYPSSTSEPQYQNGQVYSTTGTGGQNYPSTATPTDQKYPTTATPNYQTGQRFTTPGQYQGQFIPEDQKFGSRLQSQQGQTQTVNQNYPSSTVAPQYQDSQHFSTPGKQQGFNSPQQNQYGNQNFPTSTTATQYQDERYSGQRFNQPSYPGSTAAPQYQQTFAQTPGSNQPGVVPSQLDQFNRPIYNQQIPSSTTAPQGFIPGSQPQYNNNIRTSGAEVASPGQQSVFPGSQIIGNNQQPIQAGPGSVFGTSPNLPNQGFPSTTPGSLPARDFASTPGFGIDGGRPERPQGEGDRNAEILSYENVLTPEGYFYSYDTSNGIHADETGTVGDGTKAKGGFSYTGDDGKVYTVVYSADENGFQPRGDHLPTPPPIPEAIQRVIDQANRDKEAGIIDDGSYDEVKYGSMKFEGPLNRLRQHKKTMSVVNGADIPGVEVNHVGGQKKKLFNPKGSKPGLTDVSIEFGSKTEGTDSEIEEFDMDEDNGKSNGNMNDKGKRPKLITSMTVESKRPNKIKGVKAPMRFNINTASEENRQNHRPTLKGESDENASDLPSGESEDDLTESQGYDSDSDLVNYQDDPNNRTDFRGLNKYLPESKKPSRKHQSSKKRPMFGIKGSSRPIDGVNEADIDENRHSHDFDGSRPDSVDNSRDRVFSRKDKVGQKVKDQFTVTKPTVSRGMDDEKVYDDNSMDAYEEYDSDDSTQPGSKDHKNKPGTLQLRKKISGKPKRPTANQQTGISNNKKNKSPYNEETGYEYNTPQKQFSSEDANKYPSSFTPKGTQSTRRPFLTKNVYGEENEPADEYGDQYGNVKPGRPNHTTGQKHPEFDKGVDRFNPNPELNEGQGFSTTRRPISYGTTRQPFGRPQTSITPQNQEQGMTGQAYNEPNQGSRRPGNKFFYNSNVPNGDTGNVLSSTAPSPSGQDFIRHPGKYDNRPTDGSYYETSSPSGETSVQPDSNRSGQVPSTTYRPNYSFGDKIKPINVDGFGRPIHSTSAPGFDRTLRPTYSTVRPNGGSNQQEDQFRPTEGRFGVTSTEATPGYQSTSAPIGEDFSGPQQPQTFDPQTGYHYK